MAYPLGVFEIVEPIARGGMADVWAGIHADTGEEVAIKLLPSERAHDPDLCAIVRQEARSMAMLSHPNIVRILERGEVDGEAARSSRGRFVEGSPYVVMERVRGGTLAEHILGLEWGDVLVVLLRILDALAHAHARGLLHRDLKPANLLLAEGGTTWDLKLTDFGIAHPLHGERMVGPARAGTPLFMAPEQLQGDWRSYRPATDLFAVGRLATVLLRRDSDGRARVPRGFDVWLQNMVADLPQDRFPFAADAAWALRRLGPPEVYFEERAGPDPEGWTMLEAEEVADVHPTGPKRAVLGRFRPPMPVYWDQELRRVAPPLRNAGLGLVGLRPPELIGRHRERDVLWGALRKVHETGRTRIVVLRGDEGIGKQALGRWLRLRAYELGAAWPHHAAFDPLGSGVEPLTHILTREFKTEGLEHGEARERVIRLARRYGIDDPLDLEALAEAANPKDEGTPGFRFGDQRELLRLVARFLLWGGRNRPTLVHFQDVQWSMAALEMLELLLELEREAPSAVLFVLGVQRQALNTCPREREALSRLLGHGRDRVDVLDLEPLPAVDQRALIASLVGFSPRAVAELAQETEGNPLLAIQRVMALVEEGALRPGPHGLTVEQSDVRSRSVRSLWRHRLESFFHGHTEQEQVASELLAVLGRSVGRDDWLACCAKAGVVLGADRVDALVRAGFLEVDRDRFVFTHHGVRQELMVMAGEAGRLTAHHRTVADVLRACGGEESSGRIGEHLAQAGDWEEAIVFLRRGAEEALLGGRVHRARELVERFQEVMEMLDPPPEHPLRGSLPELEARLALAVNHPGPALCAAEKLLGLSRLHGWKDTEVTAQFLLGWGAYVAGEHHVAVERLTAALSQVPEGRPGLRAAIAFNLARTYALWGDVEASMRYTKIAWEAYRQVGNPRGEILCTLLAANGALKTGRWKKALALARKAGELAEQRGKVGERAEAHSMLGEIHRKMGAFERALEAYEGARRLLHHVGGQVRTALVELNLGIVYERLDQHDRSKLVLLDAVQHFHRSGREGFEAVGHCLLLPSMAATKDRSGFHRHLDAAEKLLQRVRFREEDALEALQRGAKRARRLGWDALAARAQRLREEMLGWD